MKYLLLLLVAGTLSAADDIKGFWKTVNENTGKPESIIAMYPSNGEYFGRLILTYDENGKVSDTIYDAKVKAPGVVGNPTYAGLDIIWGLKKDGDKFTGGSILDPEHGKIYDAEAWRENGNLIVRGKLLFIGRNQTWPKAEESDFPAGFKKPDLDAITPKIPEPLEVEHVES